MKKDLSIFCFGFGQVAKYFIKNLIVNNFKFTLVTTNTKNTQSKEFGGLKYKSYYFKNNEFDRDLISDLKLANKTLISIPPQNQKDIVLEKFDEIFQKNHFDWVAYLSATSIYGDHKGKWVDEKTNPSPTSKKGIARLNAENNWLKYYEKFKLPVHIFRLSGIYSFENNILRRLKVGNLKIVKKNKHYFSRIHVEDIAKILTLSLKKISPGQIFNISDDYPCSNEEIATYASGLINVDLPKKIAPDDIENNMSKDFYKDSKKVDNKKVKFFFNYNLKYPTFKEGLSSIKNQKT